jgi:hypothetical protein
VNDALSPAKLATLSLQQEIHLQSGFRMLKMKASL